MMARVRYILVQTTCTFVSAESFNFKKVFTPFNSLSALNTIYTKIIYQKNKKFVNLTAQHPRPARISILF